MLCRFYLKDNDNEIVKRMRRKIVDYKEGGWVKVKGEGEEI